MATSKSTFLPRHYTLPTNSRPTRGTFPSRWLENYHPGILSRGAAWDPIYFEARNATRGNAGHGARLFTSMPRKVQGYDALTVISGRYRAATFAPLEISFKHFLSIHRQTGKSYTAATFHRRNSPREILRPELVNATSLN